MPSRKPKAGRPALGADKRSERIRVSVTPAFLRQAEDAAKLEGVEVNDWALAALELAIARGSTR